MTTNLLAVKTSPPFVRCLLGLFAAAQVWAAEPGAVEKQAAPASPLTPMAFMVGGRWVGRLPPGPDGSVLALEMRFDWTANKQGIRFDGEFVKGGQHFPYTSGLYGWNPAKKQIVFWYSDSDGSLHQGDVSPEPGVFRQEFTITDKTGKVTNARSRLTPQGADAFTNEILVSKNGAWEKIAEVRYERQK